MPQPGAQGAGTRFFDMSTVPLTTTGAELLKQELTTVEDKWHLMA